MQEYPFYEQIVCRDGWEASIQAHCGMYCTPSDNVGPYTHVEVGFPSEREELLMPYAVNPFDLTGTVYAYVPSEVIFKVIEKHGGVVAGETPEMVYGVGDD